MRIYSIYYGPNQESEYIDFLAHKTDKAWRFEYQSMIPIIDHHVYALLDGDFLGIFSWKFREKTGISKTRLYHKVDESADVWNCSPDLGNKIAGKWTFMEWSEEGHKGITKLIQACCDHVGINYNQNPEHVIYANQFVARKGVYMDYMNTVIKPSLELLEGELWQEVNRPAGYTRALPKDELLRLTGLEFYNFVPFVLERMTMQYIDHFKIKTKRV